MNTLKLTATEDGRIKIRVVSPSERDQSAVVSFDDLQEAIRLTQTGDEAELPLEPDAPASPGDEGPVPVEPSEGNPEGVAVDPESPAEVDEGPTERQGPGM